MFNSRKELIEYIYQYGDRDLFGKGCRVKHYKVSDEFTKELQESDWQTSHNFICQGVVIHVDGTIDTPYGQARWKRHQLRSLFDLKKYLTQEEE